MIESVQKDLSKIIKEFNKKKEELAQQVGKELANSIPDFPPDVDSVGWVQYTDYFNDGEPCTFSVHSDYLYVNDEHEEEIDEGHPITKERKRVYKQNDKKEWIEVDNPDYDPAYETFFNGIRQLIGTIPEEIMQDLYGDHAMVTIYKDKSIKTTDYSDHN